MSTGWRAAGTVDTAADMLWALLPTEVLERLLVNRNWPVERYEALYARSLRSTFVKADHGGGSG